MKLAIITLLGFTIFRPYHSATILAIFHVPSKSHHSLGETLLHKLIERGHEITMISPFPPKSKLENYTHIYLQEFEVEKDYQAKIFLDLVNTNLLRGISIFTNVSRTYNNLVFENLKVQELIKSNTTFDLVIMDYFMNEAHLVFGHIFKSPVIVFTASGNVPSLGRLVGSHAPYSYVPCKIVELSDDMNFFERVLNTIACLTADIVMINSLKQRDLFLKERNYPSVYELIENISLVLTNAHYSFESPRPSIPSTVDIGGFHVKPPRQLPEELQKFLDHATEGVAYFNLGSNMKSYMLPEETIDSILKAISKLPLKFLWKWESDEVPNKPENLLVRKWFPQNDILAHPNVKVFISHGGLLSTIEAVYHGVPMIGIPFMGDQKSNVQQTVSWGYGLKILFNDLSETTIIETVNEIVNNTKYRNKAQYLSQLLKDQPLKPLDKAIYWIEHVIRHKGARHLHTTGRHLNLYQYLLLDVISVIILVVIIVSVGSYWMFRKILKQFTANPKSRNKKLK